MTYLRRLLPTALALGTVLIIVWAMWATISLRAAAQDVQAARDLLADESSLTLESFFTGDLDAVALEAEVLLRQANDRLGGRVMVPARWLPVLGRQIDAASSISRSLADLISVSVDSGQQVRDAVSGDQSLDEQFSSVAEALGRVDTTLDELDLGPDSALIGRLSEARIELDAELADLDEAVSSATLVASELAAIFGGPESHLLLIANNAEMRAGSGMILTTGVIRSDSGAVIVTDLGSSFRRNLEPGAVELTQTYEDHFGFLTPEAEWRNLGATPRFPETAESALRMWEASTGERLAGVMLVDPFLLAALMEGTGPVTIDGDVYDSSSIIDYLLHDQYLTIDRDQTNTERRAQERALAPVVLSALTAGSLDAGKVLPALIDAADRRHILMWSPDSERQKVWVGAGLDGDLEADSLALSLSNRSPSKLDYFVEVRAGLRTEVEGEIRHVKLEVAIDNTVDVAEEHWYIAGPQPWDDTPVLPGEYVSLVTLNLPGLATNATIDGVTELSVAGADGPTRIIATTLSVLPGERQTLIVRFDLPVSAKTTTVEPSARPDPIRWRVGQDDYRDGKSFDIEWSILD